MLVLVRVLVQVPLLLPALKKWLVLVLVQVRVAVLVQVPRLSLALQKMLVLVHLMNTLKGWAGASRQGREPSKSAEVHLE